MPGFFNVLSKPTAVTKKIQVTRSSKKRQPKVVGRGCEHCPLNKAKGIRKIKGLVRIKGRKIFIWTQAPGGRENEEGRELVGPAGQLLWEELDGVGITRDMCDVQNVVRCRPTQVDEDTGRVIDRTPTKEEAKCCSIYTEEALAINNSKAVIHLVFGQFAAQQLLGREHKKDTPIFWSQKLQAKVVVLDHPSYFLRGAPKERLVIWRSRMKTVSTMISTPGQFAYLDRQDYRTIKVTDDKPKAGLKLLTRILQIAKKAKGRKTIDIEDGIIDPDTGQAADEGIRVILTIGISWAHGKARTFPIDHPGIFHQNRKVRNKVVTLLGQYLTDPQVRKSAHHGTHDIKRIKELWGYKIRGYTFDTNYSSYFKWPAQRKYGLAEIAKQRIPVFAGYKDIVIPHIDPRKPNYATIPLPVITKYNCADCDIQKRLDTMTAKMEGPLLRTYTKAAFIVDDMQQRGPYLDYKYFDYVWKTIPKRLEVVQEKLKAIAKNPDINLNAWQQCAEVLYGQLRLPRINEKNPNSTDAQTLTLLSRHKRGEFPKLLVEYRELSRMVGTYLLNYKNSADLHEGQLRTLWWLTGTVTGRLRSGGRDETALGIINLQNLHGEPILKNLLVSDTYWRLAYKKLAEWRRIKQLQLFTAFDYSQIEIRILAHMSEDPVLIRAVLSGDIHSQVGHELTGIPVAKIKEDERTRTMIKALHFGIVYGLSKPSLYKDLIAQGVKISRAESDGLWDKYFKRFKRVRALIEHLKEFVQEHGYAENIFGFRIPINVGEREGPGAYWGNQAVNAPVQGAAHQLMLCGMAILADKPKTYDHLRVPVMEVHDALMFYNQTEHLLDVFQQGKEILEKAIPVYIEKHFKFKLRVPIEAECKAGYRFGTMAKYFGGSVKDHIQNWKERDRKVESDIQAKWGKLVT